MRNNYWSSSFFFLAVVSLVVFTLNGPAGNSSWSPLTWDAGFLGSDQVPEQKQVPQVVDEIVRRYNKLEKLEAGLARARSFIRQAALIRNSTSTHQDPDYVPCGPIYRNANAFHRSYLEMEKLFKIYVYEEGELPLFHDGPCKDIYSSEGSLFRDLEFYNIYRTKDYDKAMVFFLPFSVTKLVQYLYVPGDYKLPGIGRTVVDYINTISIKYPFWNRSLGADHFMLACHDWQKVLIKVSMHCDKSRKKAMSIAVQTSGVISATIMGDDKGQIEVTGVAIDIYNLLTKLRKKLKYAELLSVAPIEEKPPDKPITAETPQPTPQPQPQPVGVRLPDYYVCEVINDHYNYQSDCPIM